MRDAPISMQDSGCWRVAARRRRLWVSFWPRRLFSRPGVRRGDHDRYDERRNDDQGKRQNSRHKLKTAQITIPGGGLPAQYTQYLHTLTTSGETRMRSSRVVERAPVEHRLESRRTCTVASSRESSNVSRGHTRIVERDSGTLASNYVRVYRAHENHRTCTVAAPRESTYVYLETSVANTRAAQ